MSIPTLRAGRCLTSVAATNVATIGARSRCVISALGASFTAIPVLRLQPNAALLMNANKIATDPITIRDEPVPNLLLQTILEFNGTTPDGRLVAAVALP